MMHGEARGPRFKPKKPLAAHRFLGVKVAHGNSDRRVQTAVVHAQVDGSASANRCSVEQMMAPTNKRVPEALSPIGLVFDIFSRRKELVWDTSVGFVGASEQTSNFRVKATKFMCANAASGCPGTNARP
jgi:hypothetical protein